MRLDRFLSENKFFKSRSKAAEEIKKGNVIVNNKVILKPSYNINPEIDKIDIKKDKVLKYVSRGALKLEAAYKHFKFPIKNRVFIDAGASTGGFTDFLLKHGASIVYAVDVGKDQLADELKLNKKVINIENYNLRYLRKKDFLNPLPDFFVMDVSFISFKLIILPLIELVKEKSGIFLLKPQFESNGKFLNRKGVIKSKEVINNILIDSMEFLHMHKIKVINWIESPIKGKEGNVEFLFYIKKLDTDKV